MVVALYANPFSDVNVPFDPTNTILPAVDNDEVIPVIRVLLTLVVFLLVVILELKDADVDVNDPDIDVAVNTGLDSNVVVLVLNEADDATNAPDIAVFNAKPLPLAIY